MPNKGNRQYQADLHREGEIGDERGCRRREKQNSTGHEDGKADPIPNNERPEKFRRRLLSFDESSQMEVNRDSGSEPNRKPGEVNQLNVWIDPSGARNPRSYAGIFEPIGKIPQWTASRGLLKENAG